ncbi:MAG: hypothetical protein WAU45_21000 [Blastocatellia bacterium]
MNKQASTRFAMLTLAAVLAALMSTTPTNGLPAHPFRREPGLAEITTKPFSHCGTAFNSIRTASDSPLPINVWTSNGPEGAAIRVLAIAPSNPNIVYAVTDHGGLFKTTDGGESWNGTGSALPQPFSPQALVVDPSNPNAVYYADHLGVFKSTDGGASWSNTALEGDVSKLAIDPVTPATLYALGRLVFKSTDGGASWSDTGLPDASNLSLDALAIDPVNTNTIYTSASCGRGCGDGGLFKSTDGGKSWESKSTMFSASPARILGVLEIDASNTTNIYAGTVLGVFKSTDGGTNWIVSNIGLDGTGPVNSLAIDPSDSKTVYAGTYIGVFKSSNGGKSWDRAGLPPTRAIAFAPGNILFAGTEGGVFKSTDGAASWGAINTRLGRALVNSLAIHPGDPNVIYAGTNSGLFRSNDSGVTWKKTGLAVSSVGSLAIDSNNTDNLYAVSSLGDGTTVFKSTDGGGSWREINNGLKDDLNRLVVDPHDSNTVYVGAYYDGVFKSADGGGSWKQISNKSLFASFLVIDPVNSNILYAIDIDEDYGNFLLKSTDGGVNWTNPVNSDSLVNGPTTLAIDPHNSAILYAGTYPHAAKSTDGGASWSASDTGLPDRDSVSALAVDPGNPNAIYAATYNSGVFRSTNAGGSWSEFNGGLTDLSVHALAIEPSGINLHAGTSAGVFAYRYAAGCADAISLTGQSFDAGGGAGSIDVTAASQCSWATISNASWVDITSGSSGTGNGTVSYSVAAHTSSIHPRIATLILGGHSFRVTQAGIPLLITWARVVAGKKLFVYGENFEIGAVILLNGKEQKTRASSGQRDIFLIGKKVGKRIRPGDKLQVRNPNGSLSQEFTFAGS